MEDGNDVRALAPSIYHASTSLPASMSRTAPEVVGDVGAGGNLGGMAASAPAVAVTVAAVAAAAADAAADVADAGIGIVHRGIVRSGVSVGASCLKEGRKMHVCT